MKNILDLDSITTWHQELSAFVYAIDVWSQVEAIRKNNGEDAFLAALTYAEDRLKDDLARHLRMKAEEILSTRHDSVIAYHGCRPRDISSYYKLGILCSNKEALTQEAKEIFKDSCDVDKAARDLGPEYFDHNSGKVYLYYSACTAMQSWESHVEGSEAIRCIAQRLGRDAELQYAATGNPTLIKCAIPIKWIREDEGASIIGYAGRVIEGLIRKRLWPEKDPTGFQGAYYLTRTIPSENFIDFINMSEYRNSS